MKKIAIWKIILLSIVTLGIYTIVWFALRRVELMKVSGRKLPHWIWLVLPAFIGVILWFASLLFIYSTLSSDPGRQYDWMMLSTFTFLILIPFGISLWWVDRFGQEVQHITGNRVPVLWTMLIYFFLGPAVILVHQYYFNRVTDEKPAHTTDGPSQRFIIVMSFIVGIAIIMSINSWISFPDEYRQGRDDFLSDIRQNAP
ncbi:DUF4234 domain-containing protein [Streptomyces caniscabiei]|uniref:DUF4234 domain-containing protein n=1 Tax=Streptomyces caniscabiei TaxID=2746961 RepID=UPI0029B5C0BB|nr:DUF4234 domain-containing protein [Streptomyces caniscabiei]MDX2776441.1 DUF4234 domain-containing protein [Streptomyces caniscabiei]